MTGAKYAFIGVLAAAPAAAAYLVSARRGRRALPGPAGGEPGPAAARLCCSLPSLLAGARLASGGIRDVLLTAQPGSGWRLTARAAGAYSVTAR